MIRSPSKVGVGMWGKVGAVLLGVVVGLWFFQDDKLETLKDKRVLVTGASTGIGEQLAYHYARLGSKVAVTSRRLEALQKVTKRCEQLSPQNYTHHAITGDMSNMESAQEVIQKTTALLGGLDILVLNHIQQHGIQPYLGSKENISMFDNVLNVNYRSYVHLTSHALPELIANHGSIIVVNSLLGKVPHPHLATYSSSKFALHGFFASLRSQFIMHDQDVSVTICTLGFIGTDNSIEQIKASGHRRVLDSVKPAPPADTALAIVTSGAKREDEMYYPYWSVRPMVFLRSLFPATVDAAFRIISRPV